MAELSTTTAYNLTASPAVQAQGVLPRGWEISEDDAGREFFFNDGTGESRWNIPPATKDGGNDDTAAGGATAVETEEAGSNDEDRTAHATPATPPATPPAAAATPPPPADGQPALAGTDDAQSAHDADAGLGLIQPAVLPDGWEAVVDGDDGRSVFYHHVASGVTQWELPLQQEEEQRDTATAGAEKGVGDELQEAFTDKEQQQKKKNVEERTGVADGDKWEEFMTDEGATFRYNARSGESSWEPAPTE